MRSQASLDRHEQLKRECPHFSMLGHHPACAGCHKVRRCFPIWCFRCRKPICMACCRVPQV